MLMMPLANLKCGWFERMMELDHFRGVWFSFCEKIEIGRCLFHFTSLTFSYACDQYKDSLEMGTGEFSFLVYAELTKSADHL